MIQAFKMKLQPGSSEEYKKRHDNIWPEISEIIRKRGIYEYYIFLDEDRETLYGFRKIRKGKVKESEVSSAMKKWWEYMADLMITNSDQSPVTDFFELIYTFI